jgi:hypothetical protein
MKHLLFFLSLGVLIVSFSLPVSAGENNNPLTLLSPIGGEQIVKGSVYHVEYMAPGADCVCIETSYDGGSTWECNCGRNKTEDSQIGSFRWNVPNTTSKNCYMRITDVSGLASSYTSAPFSILEPGDLKAEQIVGEVDEGMYECSGG